MSALAIGISMIGERVRWGHGKLTLPHRACDDIAFATLAANAMCLAFHPQNDPRFAAIYSQFRV